MVGAKAAYAYDKGITGKGVTIAVIDTGIATSSAEFAGRISPDSKAFENKIARCATCAPETVTFALADVQGHGTEVASVALAARNGNGMHGVAYDATLLALKIAAPDLENVTATSVIKEADGANPMNIAPAITYAVEKGAFVISLSLNGEAGGQAAAEQRAAMDGVVKADRLLVQSVSNFVDDKSANAGTNTRNFVGSNLENKDNFLFGIRVDSSLRPPSGNGLPGDLADRTLAVVATDVSVIGKDGQLTTVTGNSFAAPAIAGAAALLKQYWPQLSGKAILAHPARYGDRPRRQGCRPDLRCWFAQHRGGDEGAGTGQRLCSGRHGAGALFLAQPVGSVRYWRPVVGCGHPHDGVRPLWP
ncbi:S8 family serine peptidase [Sphingomonas sanguinis]|uniref:S8 family serine peptidase n=1 Tax=Sphingomonas sp. LC-1 TaxID=3110957 RepID=UPI0021BAB8C2|nr:S8 family serine peptidase [Sphingomonas sp. LC-1]MCT8003782.1 S8 family serine peptidase [Sphingomonas sp. LC-1]